MSSSQRAPPLAGVFLVIFDQKVGYTIAWQGSIAGVDLSGVEYKSLPSGLHEQTADIVYYKHGGLAGVSAFAKAAAGREQRHAQFVAVGALTEASEADQGLAWPFADELASLAETVLKNDIDHTPLEAYWKRNNGVASTTTPKMTFDRSVTHESHPSRNSSDLLQKYGSLLLVLQRQALLGKRILISGPPPVQENCHLVYLLTLLSTRADGQQSCQPLYNVGIADMSVLSETQAWIACTTDAILKEKSALYDICIDLRSDSGHGVPNVTTSSGSALKATQRDVRHYHGLHRAIWTVGLSYNESQERTDEDPKLLLVPDTYLPAHTSWADVEQYTWTNVATRSLQWLSDSEEAVATSQEEADYEMESTRDLIDITSVQDAQLAQSIAVIEYFRRRTEKLLGTVDEITESNTTEEDIAIALSSVSQAGLDMWSESDRSFLEGMVKLRSGKPAVVIAEPVTLCGVRIC